ncbi:MAG: hypothetical protein J0J01_13360 [Reyranella sp.]|uniref:hypothetical protein n=1 Tax=Reyranella sp. TaxID=1929291 RepID=UPI001AD0C1E5|nr:hypothetical protein [Reyranella sp.]MBN9087893.1 hypothetical protein [Reyranella sp.]
MTESVIARTAALFLLLMAVACTPDGQPVATTAPSAPSEPFDLSSLNGKAIKIDGTAENSYPGSSDKGSTYAASEYLVVIGNTVISPSLRGNGCVTKQGPSKWSILFVPNRPQSSARIPCTGSRRVFDDGRVVESAPGDVVYSSSMSVQGNVLEMSGELEAHISLSDSLTGPRRVDTTYRKRLKIRIAGDKCQVLDFAETTDIRNNDRYALHPSERLSLRATGCAIVERDVNRLLSDPS